MAEQAIRSFDAIMRVARKITPLPDPHNDHAERPGRAQASPGPFKRDVRRQVIGRLSPPPGPLPLSLVGIW